MSHRQQLYHIASLLGEPARAMILTTLMSGYLHTAGELAEKANIPVIFQNACIVQKKGSYS